MSPIKCVLESGCLTFDPEYKGYMHSLCIYVFVSVWQLCACTVCKKLIIAQIAEKYMYRWLYGVHVLCT